MKTLKEYISRIPESNYYVDYSDNKLLCEAIEQYAAHWQSQQPDIKQWVNEVQVYETNLALGYNELAYFVHYRDRDYLCIGLKVNHEQPNFAVGWLCKFAQHEIQHLEPSAFDLMKSTLWNADFIAWLLSVRPNSTTAPKTDKP